MGLGYGTIGNKKDRVLELIYFERL